MKHHAHHFIIDSKGKGICKCGDERQFRNWLEKQDYARTYQCITLGEKKARAMDTMLNELTWPVI